MLGFRSIMEAALGELEPGAFTTLEELTGRYGTHSFVTHHDDTPAHTFIPGRIMSGLALKRLITQSESGQFGSLIQTTQSDILLNNTDGALDALVDDFFSDGRPLRIRIGSIENDEYGRERVQSLDDFAVVYTAVAGAWAAEHDALRLRVTDRGSQLQNYLQSVSYAGSGGPSGTPELTGRSVPISFGRCLNVPAQLVDPTFLTYQVHDASVDSVTAVYDRGVSVPSSGTDYPRYTALVTATIPAGTFATALSDGFFRLGSTPTGLITADVRGDNTLGYTDEHGSILHLIFRRYSQLDDTDLDLASFEALDAVQPASMGIHFPAGDRSTIQEAIEQVAFSGGAFAGQDRSGVYRVQRLEAPTPSSWDWSFDATNIMKIERERLPYNVPWRGWGVGYQHNFTIQNSSDVATGVSQIRRQFLESESRYAFAQNAEIAIAHRSSGAAPLRPSYFLSKVDAYAEAIRLLDFYGRGRALYRLTVKNALFSVRLGQVARITYPRWGLDDGKNFVVVGIDDTAETVETELSVFG